MLWPPTPRNGSSTAWPSAELKLDHAYQGSECLKQAQLRGVTRTDRVLDLIDCCWQFWARQATLTRKFTDAQMKRREHLKCVFVGISQCVSRSPWTSSETGCIHCLTTGSCLYSYFADRMLTPIEHLRMHGYPHEPLSSCTACSSAASATLPAKWCRSRCMPTS